MGIITELTMRLASVEREPEKPFSAQRPLAVVLSVHYSECPTEQRSMHAPAMLACTSEMG